MRFISFKTLFLQINQKMYHALTIPDFNKQFKALRIEFTFFEYQSYAIIEEYDCFKLIFNFNLGNRFYFKPEWKIPKMNFFVEKPNKEILNILAFHIGMVELISYWKAACPQQVIIKPFKLSNEQINWWKKLYFNGLGEFFFVNGIQATPDDFMLITCDSDTFFEPVDKTYNETVIVPVGGGKDSAVSLELLTRNGFSVVPLVVNPRAATNDCIIAAGFSDQDSLLMYRTIDPELIKLNQAGFLNGHTPFSALLAFVSAFGATLADARHIALSNESSASESTVHGSNVNHQYSKSFEFEQDFRYYLNRFITSGMGYFSFLRPLNELQIASLFSKFSAYHKSFKSCNAGSKTDQWCCNCPKCLFTYIMLSPFVPSDKLESIFGENLLDKENLKNTLDELLGKTIAKPFECVGTTEEVRTAVNYIAQQIRTDEIPFLIETLEIENNSILLADKAMKNALLQFDDQHFLLPEFEMLIKQAIDEK